MKHVVQTLRRYEEYGYSIAYFILQDEELAVHAAKAALLEAGRDRELAGKSDSVLRASFGKLAMRKALETKRSQLISLNI
ncbi:hypothetical protein [Cohnella terricola]|uniref:Uncharacterized protein n=1 Tax=Cohnella terricola TaxID=1289167 RepID=A0A559JPZ2_9BACL|nr:hypothetical protein [Cohnella terricola]TVY01955.1 hypothetical protein FPZ45_05785 [Cohnella terricola]